MVETEQQKLEPAIKLPHGPHLGDYGHRPTKMQWDEIQYTLHKQ